MAKSNKVAKAVLKDVTLLKVCGTFKKDDGEKVEFEKLSIVIDDLEFDFVMDSSVKKIFNKIVKFVPCEVDVDVDDDEDEEDDE